MSRASRVFVIVLFAAGLLVLGGLVWRPISTWRELDATRADVQAELDSVRQRNAELSAELDRMDDPSDVERRARDEFGLVRPGEEVYAVVPLDVTSLDLPDRWPFNLVEADLAEAAARR